jgi:hypothetical protein
MIIAYSSRTHLELFSFNIEQVWSFVHLIILNFSSTHIFNGSLNLTFSDSNRQHGLDAIQFFTYEQNRQSVGYDTYLDYFRFVFCRHRLSINMTINVTTLDSTFDLIHSIGNKHRLLFSMRPYCTFYFVFSSCVIRVIVVETYSFHCFTNIKIIIEFYSLYLKLIRQIFYRMIVPDKHRQTYLCVTRINFVTRLSTNQIIIMKHVCKWINAELYSHH